MKALLRRLPAVLIVAFVSGLLLSSCDRYHFIPKGSTEKRSAFVRGPDYMIFPRIYDLAAGKEIVPAFTEFTQVLGDDPALYRYMIYKDGKPDPAYPEKGTNSCMPNKSWEAIEKQAKEDGASMFVGVFGNGGMSCFNGNTIDPKSAELCRRIDALINKYSGQ